MKWIRSFPRTIPANRNYVVDGLDRFYMQDYNYSGLSNYSDDVLLVEWDIVITPENIQDMKEWIEGDIDKVQVWPYLQYPTPENGLTRTVYAHRKIIEPVKTVPPDTVPIGFFDPIADYVGFGCIFLPKSILEAFERADPKTRGLPANDERFTDQTFSFWLRHNQHEFPEKAMVHWDSEPVHLNYRLEGISDGV